MPESPGDLPSAAKQGCKRASMQGFRSASLGGGFLKYKSSHSISVRACELRRWGIRWSSLWGHETCEGCAQSGVADASGRWHCGLRWSFPWGHETCAGCADMGGGDACGRRQLCVGDACGRWHWSLRWSSLWGHETCEGCADWEEGGGGGGEDKLGALASYLTSYPSLPSLTMT